VIKIAEAVLGPNELSEFLPSDQLARSLHEGYQNFEGLVLKPNPSSALPQFTCLQIQLESLKPDKSVAWCQLIHVDAPEWREQKTRKPERSPAMEVTKSRAIRAPEEHKVKTKTMRRAD